MYKPSMLLGATLSCGNRRHIWQPVQTVLPLEFPHIEFVVGDPPFYLTMLGAMQEMVVLFVVVVSFPKE